MFDSLDEQMKKDLNRESTKRQRLLLWLAVALAAIIVFGGLYIGVSKLG